MTCSQLGTPRVTFPATRTARVIFAASYEWYGERRLCVISSKWSITRCRILIYHTRSRVVPIIPMRLKKNDHYEFHWQAWSEVSEIHVIRNITQHHHESKVAKPHGENITQTTARHSLLDEYFQFSNFYGFWFSKVYSITPNNSFGDKLFFENMYFVRHNGCMLPEQL